MKKRIRKSALIRKKRHGFRSKPRSHMVRGAKIKNLRLKLKGRRKRAAAAKA